MHRFADFEPIVTLELDHVQTQLYSNLFHQNFDSKLALHSAVAAESAGSTLQTFVDSRIDEALRRIGLAKAEDVDELAQRIAALEAKK